MLIKVLLTLSFLYGPAYGVLPMLTLSSTHSVLARGKIVFGCFFLDLRIAGRTLGRNNLVKDILKTIKKSAAPSKTSPDAAEEATQSGQEHRKACQEYQHR